MQKGYLTSCADKINLSLHFLINWFLQLMSTCASTPRSWKSPREFTSWIFAPPAASARLAWIASPAASPIEDHAISDYSEFETEWKSDLHLHFRIFGNDR